MRRAGTTWTRNGIVKGQAPGLTTVCAGYSWGERKAWAAAGTGSGDGRGRLTTTVVSGVTCGPWLPDSDVS